LHAIVKTVYALTHSGFVKRTLRNVKSDSVADAWEREWASEDCGKMWRDMSSGTELQRLACCARGTAIPSGGDVGSKVLGYRSEGGSCLHSKEGCYGAFEAVESDAADVQKLSKCKKCWP
jgi:hypothetical protein